MSAKWWETGVIYQIYPRSFYDTDGDGIGDLSGVREKLDYLVDLGVDAIWLSPVFLSPQIDNGYDVADYRQIDPLFGTNEDMRELITAAHQKKIKIIMDFVANHTSDQHQWFQESRKGRNNPYSDYYIWQDAKSDGSEPNNWRGNFGGSAWTWEESRQQYYLHYYAKEQPDLNWENPQVRQEIYDAMLYWKEAGVDGWRLDVITSISKDWAFPDNQEVSSTANQHNGPRMHEFIRELNQQILTPYEMMSVGEAPASSAKDAPLLVDPKRNELDMLFTFEHMQIDIDKAAKKDRWGIKEPDFRELKATLARWQTALDGHGWNGLYLANHDQARIPSRWGDEGAFRYESATAFATLLHGLKGTPFIYQGEEIGMTNPHFDLQEYTDVEISGNYQRYVVEEQSLTPEAFINAVHKVSRDNARTPMQWDATAEAGFTTGKPWFKVNPAYVDINVEKDRQSPKSVFRYYQALIDLRHQEAILRDGTFELLYPEDATMAIYTRTNQTETWLIAVNLTGETQELPADLIPENFQVKLHNYQKPVTREVMAPYESWILAMPLV